MFSPGSYINKTYTIPDRGNVSGTFDSLLNTNLPSSFHDSLSYDPTHAYLNLALDSVLRHRRPGPPLFGNGLNGNQQNLANTLVNSLTPPAGFQWCSER